MRATFAPVASLAAAVVVALAACGSSDVPVAEGSAEPAPSPSSSSGLTVGEAAGGPLGEVERRSATSRSTVPTGLELPALGTSGAVVPVGVTDGVLGVPEDAAVLGWWDGGARPGDGTGTVVLDGHVTFRGQTGVLADAEQLATGDEVVLTTEGGETLRYATTEVAVYEKEALPYRDIFRDDVPERLVLITCGGEVDPSTGHYDRNVVVYLEPAPPQA